MNIYEQVVDRLGCLGYQTEGDDWLISFCIEKVESFIKNFCNISTIPDNLKAIEIDRICGEFLFSMKQIGKLDQTFNLETAVKQVGTGDSNVTFDLTSSPENRINSLIIYLKDKGKDDLVCYRKIKW